MKLKNVFLALMVGCLVSQTMALADPPKLANANSDANITLAATAIQQAGIPGNISLLSTATPLVRQLVLQQDGSSPINMELVFTATYGADSVVPDITLKSFSIDGQTPINVLQEMQSISQKVASNPDLARQMFAQGNDGANQKFLSLIGDETNSLVQKLSQSLDQTVATKPRGLTSPQVLPPAITPVVSANETPAKKQWKITKFLQNYTITSYKRDTFGSIHGIATGVYYVVTALSLMVLTGAILTTPFFQVFGGVTWTEALPGYIKFFEIGFGQFAAIKAVNFLLTKRIIRKSADKVIALQDQKDLETGTQDPAKRAKYEKGKTISFVNLSCETLLGKIMNFILN